MWSKLGVLLLFLVLSGCVTVGRNFPTAPIASIQRNVTTQREIFNLFGEPFRKGVEGRYETWSYSYQYWEMGQLRQSQDFQVIFNQDGTVNNYSFSSN